MPTPPILPHHLTLNDTRYRAKFANWQILHQSAFNHVRLWQVVANFYPVKNHAAPHRQQAIINLPLVIKTLTPCANALNQAQFDHEIAMLQICQPLAIQVVDHHSSHASSKLAPNQAGVAQLLFDDSTPSATHGGFFAMPYYHAPNLRQLIQQQALSFSQSLNAAQQLCQAVTALHDLGVLQGDLKPSNILYQPNSQQMIVLDFALAQTLSHQSEPISPRPTTTAGTPAYMSPEQFAGSPPSVAQEYYSVGVILFELLTGKRPYSARTLRDWLHLHQTASLPEIMPLMIARFAKDATFSHQQAQGLTDYIQALLAKNPLERQTLANVEQIFGEIIASL